MKKRDLAVTVAAAVAAASVTFAALQGGALYLDRRAQKQQAWERLVQERDYLLRLAVGNGLIYGQLRDPQTNEILNVDRQGRIVADDDATSPPRSRGGRR